jgi:hypothetical protein
MAETQKRIDIKELSDLDLVEFLNQSYQELIRIQGNIQTINTEIARRKALPKGAK